MQITDTNAVPVELEASAILLAAGWSTVRVEQAGNGYLVAGTFQGQRHAGHTGIDPETSDDPRDMARRLVEIARGHAEPQEVGIVGGGDSPGSDDPLADELPDAPEPDDVTASGPVTSSSESALYPGVMLAVDQRKNELSILVAAMARERMQAAEDIVRNTPAKDLRNKLMMGLITERERVELTEYDRAEGRIKALATFAGDLQRAIRDLDDLQLAAFDPTAARWPS